MNEIEKRLVTMANRECYGDFFTADGERFYRCMWDGSVLIVDANSAVCPNCKRPIEASDKGELTVETVRTVDFPLGGGMTRMLCLPSKPNAARP